MALDRIAPTRRPDRPVTGHQRWQNLLFVHWSLPAELVRPLVPEPLQLDLHDGRAWVGVVPFEMVGIRPSWLPQAFALDFLETNVRTYVHLDGQPGVFFFSLEASSWLAVRAARAQWSLPYHHADMRFTQEAERFTYETTRKGSGARFFAEYRRAEALGASKPDTFEHFLLERYYLFVQHRRRLYQGQVHHAPYPAHRVEVLSLHEGLIEAAGLPAVRPPPEVAHFSPGVDVEVFGPWPVAAHQR